ncbi:MAG: efflux RND transporter periplasmic adaptor subunit [Anaerolineae bacterium]
MKNIVLFVVLLLAIGLSACAPSAAPTAIPTVVLNANPSASTSGGVSASGVIVPEPNAALSFPLTGTVKTVEVKSGDKVTKGQTLVTLDTTLWEAKVKEAQAALSAAQANEKFLVRSGQDQEHIDAASADVERMQAALDSAKATLAQATLKAPFDGMIAAVDISAAETVTPGQVVIMLGDLSNFQVETTDLSERDAPLVQPGQKAKIAITALHQDFPGTVTDVSPISSTVGGDVVYKVTIRFDTQPKGLLWGMTVDVAIETK